jgi:hypothetical protein
MEEKSIDIIVRKFYAVADLAHITHENIRVGFHHKALGHFYEAILELKDRTIEYLMGSGKIVKVNAKIIEVGDDIIKEADLLCYQFDSYAKASGDNALINLSGDLMEATAVLKYKFLMS